MVMDLRLLFLSSLLKTLKLISRRVALFEQHVGGFVAEISQKSWYRFRFFDRNGKFIDQGIALQQFQPFQFVYANEVATEHGFDMVHFDFIGGCVLKNQIVINQLKSPILIGMFQQ